MGEGELDRGPGAWAAIADRIKQALPGLRPTPRRIALHLLEDPQGASFSSIQALARMMGVNEAAIVRFARSLGFAGFADFKRALQGAIRQQLNPYGEIAMSELTSLADARQLQKLIGYELDNVRRTLHAMEPKAVARMVSILREAERIFVGGFGACRSIAELYGFLLASNFPKPVVPLHGSVSDYVARLDLVGGRDVVLVASLPPYSREDSQICRFARRRGARILLFTDSPRCPVYPVSDETLMCSSTSLLYTNSYTGLVTGFKVLMDMWLLGDQERASARMKALTETERQGYQELAGLDD